MEAEVLESHTSKNADAESKKELPGLGLEAFSDAPTALPGRLGRADPLTVRPRFHHNCCVRLGPKGVPVQADGCFSYLMHYNKLSHKSVA